jgi:hypothetical protein
MIPNITNVTLQWNEPWLFKLRTLTWRNWLWRAALFAAIYLVFMGMISNPRESTAEPQHSTVEVLTIPLLISALFLASLEIPTLQRVVSISDSQISCVGAFMVFGGVISVLMSMAQWNRRELKQVTLQRPGEAGNPYSIGLMTITLKHAAPKKVGIPSGVCLNDVADQLHSMEIPVELTEWVPPETTAIAM